MMQRLRYLALLVAAVGLVLVVVGSFMPAYTDPVEAERIRSGLDCAPGVENTNENKQCDNRLWHRSMDGLRTIKWGLVDSGTGILLSGLTVYAFLWWNRRKSWRQLSTPKSIWSILALAALAWLIQIPAYVLHFMTELTRGYHPHWADSIAIPIYQFQAILLAMFLPYMVICLLFVLGARLPTYVFTMIPGRPVTNIFWTAASALLLVPIILVLIGAILEGPTAMVPFLLLTLWLALCARAAALTRYRPGAIDRQPA